MTKLSILIASLGRRHKQLQELLDGLMPQVDKFKGNIEVIVYRNNGKQSIGEYRQALLEEAKGRYVCFVDDDDKVPDYYCEEIMNALGKDYVGFKVLLTNNEIERPPVYHSIRYSGWYQDARGYYRGVTHLNPIKRSIALKGDFRNTNGSGEDEIWAVQVRPFVKTENYIDKFMYYYRHNTEDTHFGGVAPKWGLDYPQPIIKSKNFRWLYETNNKV